MRKKQDFPRKRKRVLKKIIFLITITVTSILVIGGGAYIYFIVKTEKPLLSSIPKIHVLQANAEDKAYQELQNGLEKNQIAFSSITESNGSLVVALQGGGKVTFSSQKDIMVQIASLQYILSHLTMLGGKQFSSLDLRFDQPVIVLKH